jgi:Mn2+/Fe2+ NRAMP family transporter
VPGERPTEVTRQRRWVRDDRAAPEHPLDNVLPGEARVLWAAEESLSGRRRGPLRFVPFLAPAFIAAVAYVDPGNFATNMAGGATYGYLLLWVVLTANLMAMLVTAAAVFNTRGLTDVGDDLQDVYDGLGQHLGNGANVLFGIALLASGLSSSSVGILAGQVVMQGFVDRRIPLFLRRAITMAPAFVVIGIGVALARDQPGGAVVRHPVRSSRCCSSAATEASWEIS